MQLPTLCWWQNSSFLFVKVLLSPPPAWATHPPMPCAHYYPIILNISPHRFQNLISDQPELGILRHILSYATCQRFTGNIVHMLQCTNCGVMNTNDVYKLCCPVLIITIISTQLHTKSIYMQKYTLCGNNVRLLSCHMCIITPQFKLPSPHTLLVAFRQLAFAGQFELQSPASSLFSSAACRKILITKTLFLYYLRQRDVG